jgi:hypothetical protein
MRTRLAPVAGGGIGDAYTFLDSEHLLAFDGVALARRLAYPSRGRRGGGQAPPRKSRLPTENAELI